LHAAEAVFSFRIFFCRAHSPDLIRGRDRFDDAGGDWLSVNADTSTELIGTVYLGYSTNLVAMSAKALGKTEEAAKYERVDAMPSATAQ